MLAVLCQDENMIRDASEGKDLYSAVAAKAFHTTYEECLEHFPKDTPITEENGKFRYATKEEIDNKTYTKLANGETDTYKEGKERRKQAKVILLGMMYHRGDKALSEQLGCSRDEAKEIMNSVFDAFPNIKKCDEESEKFAYKYGFTTTIWGRKRRLPDLKLPPYEFNFKDSLVSEAHQEEFIRDMTLKLKSARGLKEKNALINYFSKEYKVKLTDNQGFIAQAVRQVLNSRIQGSAADMTKKALVAIDRNKRLKELGFSTLVPIHDEILGQCPLANLQECKDLFIYEMSNCAKDRVPLDITVDPVCSFAWNGPEYEG